MTKQQARAAARARWQALPPAQIATWGAAMAAATAALPVWRAAGSVFCFVSLPAEPDTRPLLRLALRQGKRLLVPRMLPERGRMEAVPVAGLGALRPGRCGIAEPPPGGGLAAPGLPPDTLTIVPCLAASPDGVRLGRGGGYYDRFLAGYRGRRLLWCPTALLFPRLPADAWDVRFAPGEILTEEGLWTCP